MKITTKEKIPFIAGSYNEGSLSDSKPYSLRTPDNITHSLTKIQWLKLGGAEKAEQKQGANTTPVTGLALLKEKYEKIGDKRSSEAKKLLEEITKLEKQGANAN